MKRDLLRLGIYAAYAVLDLVDRGLRYLGRVSDDLIALGDRVDRNSDASNAPEGR